MDGTASWRWPYEATPCETWREGAFPCHEARRVNLAAGETLWRAGESARTVALLCRGVVTLGTLEEGRRQVVGLEAATTVLGMDDTLWSGQRDTDVVALIPSQVFMLDTSVVLATIARGGESALSMTALFGQVSRFALRRVREVGYGSVTERIARVLVHILDRVALPDARGRFVPVPLGRTQFADLVGCRVETLVRTLKGAPLAEIVLFQREGFVVSDERSLRRLAISRTI